MLNIPARAPLLYKNKPTKSDNYKTNILFPKHRCRQQQTGADIGSVLVTKVSL